MRSRYDAQHNVQKIYFLNIGPSECVREIDVYWNISWPSATSGEVVQQKCPGGAESVGMYVCI